MHVIEVLSHGREAGLVVHVPGTPPRSLLLGPVRRALARVPDRMDGRDLRALQARIEAAAATRPRSEIEAALDGLCPCGLAAGAG